MERQLKDFINNSCGEQHTGNLRWASQSVHKYLTIVYTLSPTGVEEPSCQTDWTTEQFFNKPKHAEIISELSDKVILHRTWSHMSSSELMDVNKGVLAKILFVLKILISVPQVP